MPRCVNHPGRESVLSVNSQNYCENCQDGIVSARARVDRHVVPKDCFVWSGTTGSTLSNHYSSRFEPSGNGRRQ